MAFSQKHLYNNEQIVIDKYPHWIFLAPPAAALIGASALGIWALAYNFQADSNFQSPLRWIAAALVVVTLIAFLSRLISWRSTEFVVTTERCIYRSGVLKKTGIEIPLDRISTVFFSQSIFERMLRAGDIGIESAGEGSRQNFSNISNPMDVQNTIYKQMEEHENRKYDRIGSETREGMSTMTGAGQPAPTQMITVAEQIEKLADLHQRGVITAEEFASQKQQLLG